MSKVEFIPNQPIIFEDPIGVYDCLNVDDTIYNVLAEPGDKLCVQWKMLPCYQTLCEPNMYAQTGDNLNDSASWDADECWSSIGGGQFQFDGSFGTTAGGASLETQPQINFSPYEGYPFVFRFEIFSISNIELTVELNFPFTKKQVFNTVGIHEFYFVPKDDTHDIEIYWDTTAIPQSGDAALIGNFEIYRVSDCWHDKLTDVDPPSEPANTWDYSYDINTQQGKWCHIANDISELENINAYVNNNNYHGVTFTILDMTTGSVDVILGTVNFGTITSNGSYTLYGYPTSGNTLNFIPTSDFNGCITNVSVNDYGPTNRFDVVFYNDNVQSNNSSPTLNYYDDRVVLCELYSNLDLTQVGDCMLLSMEIIDNDCGESQDYYLSVNKIALNTNGWPCTKIIEAWSDKYAFGFYFGDILNPDFTLIHRIRVLQFNPKYSNEVVDYLYSNGGRTRTFSQSQKYRQCKFDYIDEYGHDCIRTQLLCDKLKVGGDYFFYKSEEYEPEWNERGKYNLAQSQVELIHENAIFGSICGTQSNAQCPPQTIQVATGELKTARLLGTYRIEKTEDLTSSVWQWIIYDLYGNPNTITSFPSPFNLTTVGGRSALETAINNLILTYYPGSIVSSSVQYTLTATYQQVNLDFVASVSVFGNHSTLAIFPQIYFTKPTNPYILTQMHLVQLY